MVKEHQRRKPQPPSYVRYKSPRQDLKRLKAHLKQFGGKGFQLDYFLEGEFSSDEVEILIRGGRLFEGEYVDLKNVGEALGCEPRECHWNAITVSKALPDLKLYTGFVLDDDNMWRVHSWTVDKDGVVHEPTPRTVPRMYYGVPAIDVGGLPTIA